MISVSENLLVESELGFFANMISPFLGEGI